MMNYLCFKISQVASTELIPLLWHKTQPSLNEWLLVMGSFTVTVKNGVSARVGVFQVTSHCTSSSIENNLLGLEGKRS